MWATGCYDAAEPGGLVMEREMVLKHWDVAWTDGLWAAPWRRVLEGLTPVQAAWRAQPGRRCIWEHIGHMLFWREVALRRLKGEKVEQDERQWRNWEMPHETSAAAFDDLRSAWEQSHRQVRAAIADGRSDLSNLQFLAYHDSYHVGQVMLLRALQGLAPIE